MNCNKIEELYIDFILDLIGPNLENEQKRNSDIDIVTKIIKGIINKKFTNFNTYIFHYGSFPMKAYLKNADIDLTIFLQSKDEQTIMKEMSIELINNIIIILKEGFERYNKDSHFAVFSEIKVIMADIRLLKCKIHSLSLDISINNFSGIYKVIFISYIEKLLKNGFQKMSLFVDNSYIDNKIQIFRRTLILIKGWCSFEGNLMGSNIGLMASYALEILVIYVFNLHYNNINNEFDGFEKFFELMDKIDWENNIISLYGIFKSQNFIKILENYNTSNQKNRQGNKNNQILNEPFWYLDKKINLNKIHLHEDEYMNEPIINLNELKKLIAPINKSMGNIYLYKEGNIINEANFGKLINILDPLNNHNNLGKSISYHSKAKMKKIISYMNKQIKYIKEKRKEGKPFVYMNCLLNLFKITLSTTYLGLFIKYMNKPRLIANSTLLKNQINENDTNHNNDKEINNDNNDDNNNKNNNKNNFTEEIYKFNKLFTKKIIVRENFDEEDNDKYVEENEDSEEDEDKFDKNSTKRKTSIEDNCEEDEYAEVEDEEYIDAGKENNNNKNKKIKEENAFDKKFVPLINEEIIKKLFELYNSKQKIIKFNNDLLEDAIKYSDNLEKFLKDNKLI